MIYWAGIFKNNSKNNSTPMAHEIIPIERIQQQAVKAAQKYANVNDACPYPRESRAAEIFKEHFFLAREQKERGVSA